MKKVFIWSILVAFLNINLESCTGCSKSGSKSSKRGGAKCSTEKNDRKNDLGDEYKRLKNMLNDFESQYQKDPQNSDLLNDTEVLERDAKHLKTECEGKIVEDGIAIFDQDSDKTKLLTVLMVEELVRDVSTFKNKVQNNQGSPISIDSEDPRIFFEGRYRVISDCTIASGSIITIESYGDHALKQKVRISNFLGTDMYGIVALSEKKIYIEDTPIYIGNNNNIQKGEIIFGEKVQFNIEVKYDDSITKNCSGMFVKII